MWRQVSDINIEKFVIFHKIHGMIATLTSIQREGRFGVLESLARNDQLTIPT